MMDAQQQAFARREAALDRGEPAAHAYEEDIDRSIRFRREYQKRTQSKPTENPAGDAETQKCPTTDAPPVTKRTQCDDHASAVAAAHRGRTASPADPLQSGPS
jgi:hypothetical protein